MCVERKASTQEVRVFGVTEGDGVTKIKNKKKESYIRAPGRQCYPWTAASAGITADATLFLSGRLVSSVGVHGA